MPTRDELLRQMDKVGIVKWSEDPANERYLPSWLKRDFPARIRAQVRPYSRAFQKLVMGKSDA